MHTSGKGHWRKSLNELSLCSSELRWCESCILYKRMWLTVAPAVHAWFWPFKCNYSSSILWMRAVSWWLPVTQVGQTGLIYPLKNYVLCLRNGWSVIIEIAFCCHKTCCICQNIICAQQYEMRIQFQDWRTRHSYWIFCVIRLLVLVKCTFDILVLLF